MSLIFCDGVDDGLGALGKWDLGYGVNSVPNTGRNGNCYKIGDYNQPHILHKSLGSDEHATVTVGIAILGESASAFHDEDGNKGHIEFRSDSGATLHVRVILEYGNGTAPKINVYRGTGTGSLIASAAVPVYVANQWYYVEAQATLHDSTGAVVVKINGTTYINATGVDTKNAGTKTVFDSIALKMPAGGASLRLDDIYFTNGAGSVNTGFLGDVAVETLLPSGDGSSSQWVGSDGNSVNNSLLVDEAAPNTTDYVQSSTAGNKDLYAFTDLVRTGGTIYGVVVSSYAQKSDSGDVSLKNAIKSGASALSSAAKALMTTYWPVSSVFETDPATSAAWTIAAVAALEAGVEVA